MRSMRSVFLLAVLALSAAAVPAGAEPLPPYDGSMTFQSIQGVEGPEEFSWEVNLDEGEELRPIDDTQAGVYRVETDTLIMSIVAQRAHDSEGSTVPTTIAVTQPNVITLTVHHRAGNPAAAGAPFDYPVIAGDGWEGGIQIHHVVGPPAEVQPPAPIIRCVVPDLGNRTLRASRKMLRHSHCRLGEVRGERRRGARVVRQFRTPGTSLPDGSEVGVKLLRP
jgi:hypothetical protein